MLVGPNVRRVAVVGGMRIPFARGHGAYARVGNQDMFTAVLQALVAKYRIAGERLGDVTGGAVLKHSKDFNLVRECVLSSGLDPATPGIDMQRACGTGLDAAITIAMDSEFMVVGAETLQFIMLRDVSELKRQSAQVTYLAYHDQLTGLHNRASYNRELERMLETGLPFSLLLMDLNKFKSINDLYGHHAGDQALRFVADCLRTAGSHEAFVGRLAGDEFVAVLPISADYTRFLSILEHELAHALHAADVPDHQYGRPGSRRALRGLLPDCLW